MGKFDQVQKAFLKLANPQKAKVLAGFFKTGKGEYGEGDVFLGITVPQVRQLAKQFSKDIDLSVIQKMLHSKYHELRMAGLLMLIDKYKKAGKQEQKIIFGLYLKNTNYINNWDLVDLTAEHIVGAYLEKKPKDILFKLAHSKLLWDRRISILATFRHIKQKQPGLTIQLAKILLRDKHDLIQKAVGWMLREVGKRCSEEILIEFLDANCSQMPRTCLRYAIERLPEKARKEYLAKKLYPA